MVQSFCCCINYVKAAEIIAGVLVALQFVLILVANISIGGVFSSDDTYVDQNGYQVTKAYPNSYQGYSNPFGLDEDEVITKLSHKVSLGDKQTNV